MIREQVGYKTSFKRLQRKLEYENETRELHERTTRENEKISRKVFPAYAGMNRMVSA